MMEVDEAMYIIRFEYIGQKSIYWPLLIIKKFFQMIFFHLRRALPIAGNSVGAKSLVGKLLCDICLNT